MSDNAFTRALSTPVPQTERENNLQVLNSAGGYTFSTSDRARLERFLILGTDGGTYYIGEAKLTRENCAWLVDLIVTNPLLVIDVAAEISTSGRAYKNSPAVFALALCFSSDNDEFKHMIREDYFDKIIRTSMHLYEYSKYIELLGGWGSSKRKAIAGWYARKSSKDLAYQVVKYRQRDGWTHRDLFRLVHPGEFPPSPAVDENIANFILGKEGPVSLRDNTSLIEGFKIVQEPGVSRAHIKDAIITYGLPWEALPTNCLKDPDIWKTLFFNGQLKGQALIRNITRLSRIGAFSDMVFAGEYAKLLADPQMIEYTRLHPINYLNSVVVHTEGQIDRDRSGFSAVRKKDWTSVPVIVDALNSGFYEAFKYAKRANKRTMIALDVSGSMGSPALGLDLSCSQVTCAMSMAVARTEPYYIIKGFSHQFVDLSISPGMDLNASMKVISGMPYGGTDCSIPMVWARKNKIEIDTFLVMTDNETWSGGIQPHKALQHYRSAMGIDAKLIVAGITSTEFTIADPRDRGMLDICGADSNLPGIVSDFSAGRI